ncbi:glycerol-3-phosphate dehydrogenase [Gemmatimonadetes bacterium T265]|nr:glycerol-3-phosphate dehydrogenase [Gemmatimonadetes bacterium T265]
MLVTPALACRASARDALADGAFDLAVVGGGITGAGVARDAALRGLRVALVERDDWASGTSSRSSRLVHGGVRYLEHGHLGLVFEASRERRILLRTAPHLVRPLAFTWPTYRGARVPRWKLEAGLALYDALALWRNVAAHRPLSPRAVRDAEPALAATGLTGGARYYDAATDDGRLTLATALAAARAGAATLNHAAVVALAVDRAGESRARVCVRDALDGAEFEIRARAVVNATGPWSDTVRRLHQPRASAAVLGAKGVHVAVPAERVGNRGALTLLAPDDGRVTFVLPAGPHTILGTTETAAERGPDEVRASEADVAYLLAVANHYFPPARLERADVVSAWAGVRPLAAAAPRAGGGTGGASREHAIDVDPRGVVTVTGGKLTTYRSMAASVVDAACALLGERRPRAPTDRLPLEPGYEAARARVAELAASDPALAAPVAAGLPHTGAECLHAVEAEQAATLADLLMRRAPVAYGTRDAGRAAARVVAPLVAPALGWDGAAVARALAAYDADAARVFGVDA